MVTVEPCGRVPLDGFWLNTLPGVALDGPAAVMTWTLNPWFCRIETAVACGSPTVSCTWVPPPETEIVTVLFGSSSVPAAGDWLTTALAGLVEFGAVLVTTWKFCSWLWAVASDSPVTFGILIFFGPADTFSVTTLFGATLVPKGGLVLMTRPFLVVADGALTTFDVSPALATAFSAADWVRPTTDGTALVFPPPPLSSRYAITTIRMAPTTPRIHHRAFRRPLPPS